LIIEKTVFNEDYYRPVTTLHDWKILFQRPCKSFFDTTSSAVQLLYHTGKQK